MECSMEWHLKKCCGIVRAMAATYVGAVPINFGWEFLQCRMYSSIEWNSCPHSLHANSYFLWPVSSIILRSASVDKMFTVVCSIARTPACLAAAANASLWQKGCWQGMLQSTSTFLYAITPLSFLLTVAPLVLVVPEQEFHKEMSKINSWLAELRSLGVDAKTRNDLNDEKELHDMTDNIKRSLYQEYKKAYASA